MNRIEFVLPSSKVLNEFEHVTNPVFEKIDENQRSNKTLAALRDALLPKLLSGELRVRDADRAVEEML